MNQFSLSYVVGVKGAGGVGGAEFDDSGGARDGENQGRHGGRSQLVNHAGDKNRSQCLFNGRVFGEKAHQLADYGESQARCQ